VVCVVVTTVGIIPVVVAVDPEDVLVPMPVVVVPKTKSLTCVFVET
jgi:hypothetical protein